MTDHDVIDAVGLGVQHDLLGRMTDGNLELCSPRADSPPRARQIKNTAEQSNIAPTNAR